MTALTRTLGQAVSAHERRYSIGVTDGDLVGSDAYDVAVPVVQLLDVQVLFTMALLPDYPPFGELGWKRPRVVSKRVPWRDAIE